MGQPCRHGLVPPGQIRLGSGGLQGAAQPFRQFDEPFGRVRAAVQEHILDMLPQLGVQFGIDGQLPGIHNAHVQPRGPGVVQEGGVHRLPDRGLAAEGKGDVADTPAHLAVGQFLLDAPHRLDEGDRIVVVFLDPGAHRQNVGVQDDVLGRESMLREQAVGPAGHFQLALQRVGLARLVEGHHDHRGSVPPAEVRLPQELLLTLLEAQRVDQGLALHLPQTGLQNLPAGGIDHDRHPRHIGFPGQQAQETAHTGRTVQQAVVEVHVHHLGTVGHLLRRHLHRVLEAVPADQAPEARGPRNVGALADVDEVDLRCHPARFHPGQHRGRRVLGRGARGEVRQRGPDAPGVVRPRTATAAGDVQFVLGGGLPEGRGHFLGGLVVAAEGIGQTGIGIAVDAGIRNLRQPTYVRQHVR